MENYYLTIDKHLFIFYNANYHEVQKSDNG